MVLNLECFFIAILAACAGGLLHLGIMQNDWLGIVLGVAVAIVTLGCTYLELCD